jgi:hypothetical protein
MTTINPGCLKPPPHGAYRAHGDRCARRVFLARCTEKTDADAKSTGCPARERRAANRHDRRRPRRHGACVRVYAVVAIRQARLSDTVGRFGIEVA